MPLAYLPFDGVVMADDDLRDMGRQQIPHGVELDAVDGRRMATVYDLQIVQLNLTNLINTLTTSIAASNESRQKYETLVDKNTDEVSKLRAHQHEHANQITALNVKTSALDVKMVVELIRLIPVMQHLERIAEKRELQDVPTTDELLWLRAEKLAQEKRQLMDAQVSIGKRIQNYGFPLLFALFIIENIVQQLHLHL